MPYPPTYTPRVDFSALAVEGASTERIAQEAFVEFAHIADTLNQQREFLRQNFTANKLLKPAAAQTMTLLQQETFTATAGQTVFTFVSLTDVDAANDYARVFTDAAGGGTLELIDPASVTLSATDVTIPAQTVGATVVVELYQTDASVLAKLADNAATMGASLVAIEDAGALLSAANVEDALAEIQTNLNNLVTSLGDLTDYIKADGSIDFAADQSMGNNKLTSLADGTDPGDAVNVSQFQTISAQFSNLAAKYLALAGGTMSGPINMGNNKITSLADGAAAKDAVNKSQLDAVDTAIRAAALLRDGSNAATGDIPMGGNKFTGLADGTDPTDSATVGQIASEVSDQLANASAVNIGGTGILKNLPITDPSCTPTGVGADGPGVYDYDDLNISVNTTIPKSMVIRVRGDFTLSADLTVDADGDTSAMFASTQGENGTVTDILGAGSDGTGGHGGGGVGGAGGRGSGTPNPPQFPTDPAFDNDHYPEFTGVMAYGGDGALLDTDQGVKGGGCVYILVEGNCIFTGGRILANGDQSVRAPFTFTAGSLGTRDTDTGGAGGGMIVVICKGTITDGTFEAKGGIGDSANDGLNDKRAGGGGGGGKVSLFASAFAGTQNIDVSGGAGFTGASNAGADGVSETSVLTAAQISAIGGRIM